MQVIGANTHTNHSGFRWERADAEAMCDLKAATGNLNRSVDPQRSTKSDAYVGIRLLREHSSSRYCP